MTASLAACGKETAYTVYVGEGTGSLDPKKCMTRAEETYAYNLFSGLYEYLPDGNGYKLSPADAEGLPTVSATEDGKFVYTFTLREGLKWSNGDPITPEDYVTAWNESAAYSLYTDKGYIFSLIDGYETYTSYEENAALNMTFDNKRRTFSVTVTEDSEVAISGAATGLTIGNWTLSLLSETTARIFFTVEGDINDSEFLTIDAYGEEKALVAYYEDGRYRIDVRDINAAELDTTIKVIVRNTTDSSECEISFSAMCYVAGVLANEGSTDSAKKLVKALKLYNIYANEYFEKNN